MKIRFLLIVLLGIFLVGGCVTAPSKSEKKEGANKNIKTYTADLNGDGGKEIVETEDRFNADSVSVITVKKQVKKKKIPETIDSVLVSGKIKKLDFIELIPDGGKKMAVYFDGKDNFSNIVIYQLQNDKLSMMFAASSLYGIDAQFAPNMPRIKIGKLPSRAKDSPNIVPEWDTWVWTGDKFIKD